MIVVVPAVMPVTMPVAEPTVATAVLLLSHVPPAVALDNVVVPPMHMAILPVIGAGSAFIVSSTLVEQPDATV